MAKVKIRTVKCPYCGGTDFVKGYQAGHGGIVSIERPLTGTWLYHTICLSCGSVTRSYVADPMKLIKKKNRDKYIYE
jgi:hypothetical protein